MVARLEPADMRACAVIECMSYPAEVAEGEAVLARHRAHFPAGALAARSTGGVVMGYALAAPVRFDACPLVLAAEDSPEAAGLATADADTLYLHDLAVAPTHRGCGVAEELLCRVAALAPTLPITLTAVCGAAGYWQRRGFAAVEPARMSDAACMRLADYPPVCDAQLMQRAPLALRTESECTSGSGAELS